MFILDIVVLIVLVHIFTVLINFGSYKLVLIAVLSFLTETDTLNEKDATKAVNTDSCLST
jgi:uncharacterized membrane protein